MGESDDGTAPGIPLARRLYGFLEEVSLMSDVDTISDAEGAVTLMTLHAAKGLEFPAVAMIGVEDGLLPHERARSNEHEMEEERRLCFVGITRARRHLFLSRAKTARSSDRRCPRSPSPFLMEMPAEAVRRVDETADNDWVAGEDRFEGMSEQRRQGAGVGGAVPAGRTGAAQAVRAGARADDRSQRGAERGPRWRSMPRG